MSSRQFKLLHKQQQKQEIEQNLKEQQEEEEEEIEQIGGKAKQLQTFFMMDDSEDEEEQEEQNDSQENQQKLQQQEEEEQKKQEEEKQQQQQGKKGKKNKKNKNKKNKNQQQQQQEEEKDEDLDKILEELDMKVNLNQENEKKDKSELKEEDQEEFKQEDVQFQQGNLTLSSPLQIIQGKLNYDKEFQKYFSNAKIIEEQQIDDSQYEGIKDKRLLKRLKQQRKPKTKKQLKLVYNLNNTMPVPERFIVRQIETNKYGQDVFAFYPTKQYEKLQDIYEGLKNTMDPQNTFDFVQKNPYHVDATYDISEFCKLQGQFKQANQLLSQILYVYEDSFGPVFSQIFDDIENKFALSFDHNIYAKTLFMAILKFTDILGKKGCFRAALEYNKFLVKLNPYEDPVGGLLCLDYFALSSKQYGFLSYFAKNFAKILYKNSKFSILYMPNMIYSVAIAKYLDTKDHILVDMDELITFKKDDFDRAINFDIDHIDSSANVLILQAILLYPQLIVDLSEKNEFHKVNVFNSVLKGSQKKSFKDLIQNQFFLENTGNTPYYGFLGLGSEEDIQGLKKIFDIYPERSKIIYKNKEIVLWLKAALGFLIDQFEERGEQFDYQDFTNMLCEKREFNIIPFSFSRYKDCQKSNFSDHVDRLDLNNIEEEEQAQMQQQMQQQMQNGGPGNLNPLDQNAGYLQSLLQSFLPWVNLPQQDQQQQQNQGNIVYQDDDVQINDENDDDEDNEDED